MSTYIREHTDWKENWVNFKPTEFECSCCQRLDISSELKAKIKAGTITEEEMKQI